MSVNAESGALK